MAGSSAFVTGSNTFRIEALKKHNASIKHITCPTNALPKCYLSCRIVLQIKNFMLTTLLVNHLQVNIAYMDSDLKKEKKK